MIIGTRVLYPEEINTWNAELLQISVYRDMKGNLEMMKNCARRCREAGIRYVIHPVGYPLLQHESTLTWRSFSTMKKDLTARDSIMKAVGRSEAPLRTSHRSQTFRLRTQQTHMTLSGSGNTTPSLSPSIWVTLNLRA
jgi:hypothetical protein